MIDLTVKIWHLNLSNINADVEIKEGCTIHAPVWIGADVKIGKNCKIQAFVFIPNGVTIGDKCFIGPHVCFTNDKNPPSNGKKWTKTIVEDNVAIGARAVILPGIKLEKGCKIGAGAVVTKDVARGTTVVGNPAKVLDKK